MGWLSKLFNLDLNETASPQPRYASGQDHTAKREAYNRLKLVLMHDRTQLSPDMIERMRDDLVRVISKYVEIDKDALELNLETESTTVALVANIPVLSTRQQVKEEGEDTTETVSEKTALPKTTGAVTPPSTASVDTVKADTAVPSAKA